MKIIWSGDDDKRLVCMECTKKFNRIVQLEKRIEQLESGLKEIRDVAACSEGVEFYAMLADNALMES